MVREEKLAEQYSGLANAINAYTVRVDWAGAVRFLPFAQTAGYLMLHLNRVGAMTATMHLAGELPVKA